MINWTIVGYSVIIGICVLSYFYHGVCDGVPDDVIPCL